MKNILINGDVEKREEGKLLEDKWKYGYVKGLGGNKKLIKKISDRLSKEESRIIEIHEKPYNLSK